VVIPERSNILFDGTVIYTKGSQAQINVTLKNAFRDPVAVEGMVIVLPVHFLCSLLTTVQWIFTVKPWEMPNEDFLTGLMPFLVSYMYDETCGLKL